MKSGQSRGPQSVKNQRNQFFPSKYSPIKQDYQYYVSENPTPMRKGSKDFGFQIPEANMISINNGVHNQVYYIQPVQRQHLNLSSGGESLDQFWKRQSQNTSHQNSNQILEQPKKSKAQTQLFTMLMNDAMNRTTKQERKSSKAQTNITTPHNINNSYNMRRDQQRNNNSLQRRLEETYNLKSTKSKPSNNQPPQQNSWYIPQPRYQQQSNSTKQQQNSKQIMNQSLGKLYKLNKNQKEYNTGEVSFENNILQRGFQGDYSGFLQIQSDNSKNDIKPDDYEIPQYHPRALELLQEGKMMLKNKTIQEAIDLFKQSIDADQSLLESHYFLGICYLGTFQYTKAIQEFLFVINADPAHRRNVYLLLAISYKKINEIDQAINTLSRAILIHPRYYDAYIYRGKLLLKQKNVEKAANDFTISIQLNPNKGLGYLGKADCYRCLGNFREAIKIYTKAIQSEQAISHAAILKKSIAYFESKQYEESLKDLNTLLQLDQSNSEAFYFRGLCKLKLGNPQEAVLSFEQSIKHNNSKKAVTKSLYEIAKIKIDQRDFYAAYHTLNRSDYLDTERSYLERFKLFTEAVIFLMKRKFTESIQNFSSIQQHHSLNDFLKPLFFTYRAYGYFCLSQHQQSLDDYKTLEELGIQQEANIIYNRLLCEGILKVQNNQWDKGIEAFQKAGKVYPKKLEPIFYQGVSLIKKSYNVDGMKLLMDGLKLIDQASTMSDNNANLFYVRAIIKAGLELFDQAITDIDKAIEKSEDNVPKYFYLRGLIYSCRKQFKQAASDFSICINLDENYALAYLQRAKCQFLYGDTTQAFSDLQQYISLQPDDPQIHFWAGNFLFANGAIEDAIKAYTHAPDFNSNIQLLLLRSQCFMVLGQLDNCLEDVKKLAQLENNISFIFDRDCLAALKLVFRDTSEVYFNDDDDQKQLEKRLETGIAGISALIQIKNQGELFKQHHLCIFRGVFLFHLAKYEEALKNFQLAKSQKELYITEKKLSSKESPSEEEEDADLLEILEIKFNELACLVMLKQYRKAKEKCKQLIDNINEAKQEGLQYLSLRLEYEIRKQEGKDFKKYESDYDGVICLYDEPKENPICFQVPIIFIKMFNDMKIRLSFSLPKISPPKLTPLFEKELLQSIGPLSVENKPEAPWIRREQQGEMIMFTDNIQLIDDIRLETEEKEEQQLSSSKQLEQSDLLDKNKIKKKLMLDSDIEEKLKKILEKKKQN